MGTPFDGYCSTMRTAEQRKRDALAKLEGDIDVWVATADVHGVAHLVPLSLCWHDGGVIVATEAKSRTARNARQSGQARLALGPSRDVVMIDATASVVDAAGAEPQIKSAYHGRRVGIPEPRVASGSSSCCGPEPSRCGRKSTRSPEGPSCETGTGSCDDRRGTLLTGAEQARPTRQGDAPRCSGLAGAHSFRASHSELRIAR